jgi:hypothetical protein
MNVFSKQNVKHVVEAVKSYNDGVKEASRRSCDEIALNYFKKRQKLNPLKNRKEG